MFYGNPYYPMYMSGQMPFGGMWGWSGQMYPETSMPAPYPPYPGYPSLMPEGFFAPDPAMEQAARQQELLWLKQQAQMLQQQLEQINQAIKQLEEAQ